MSIVKRDVAGDAILAAFDIGSNSIKMTVARVAGSDEFEEFSWGSETVRLGAGLDATGRLSDDRIDAALSTLTRFAEQARGHGATRLIGVATEATRVAENGAAFLDRVRHQTGIEIKTISGNDEAALTFRGLAASIDVSGDVVVADIGGGSTEVIVAHDGRPTWSRSIALGSGRLTERHVATDPPSVQELATCRGVAEETLSTLDLPHGSGSRLIVVGGTGEYMMRLLPSSRPPVIGDIDAALAHLTTISAADLATRLDMPVARARVFPAGVAIVRAVATLTEPEVILGARSGIRTGLLLAAISGEI